MGGAAGEAGGAAWGDTVAGADEDGALDEGEAAEAECDFAGGELW